MASDETIEDILASLVRRQEALREHLKAQPTSEISGVIYPGGLSGSGGGNSDRWTFSMCLNPWRSNDGELKHQTIRLIKEGISNDELRELMDSMASYEVIRVSAKFSESCPEWDTPQGLLESVLETKAQNKELSEQSEALKKPFSVNDPFFGRMKLDRSVNWLECKRRNGLFSTYKVCISRNGERYDGAKAKEIVTSLEARMPEIREAIRSALHDTYNDCWESIGKLSAAQFLKRIKLQSIVVSKSGSAGCWFEDGGLFLGHSIEVRIDENGEIKGANLAG
ncbi:MAG: DUF2262 domain-containing protein [Prosthecobacter sp.]|uniref:DUF2262 domain-containing protein n=1 Tax=Prosthecobacter sp. TaxID=1965333 RepID=UPI0019FFC8B2|nr:DUF2262 domain-containing protein [Prosthecobacter sp.]MBE2286498.1 DUF2262 domain-containing protein [Prosthecobacter sp.]